MALEKFGTAKLHLYYGYRYSLVSGTNYFKGHFLGVQKKVALTLKHKCLHTCMTMAMVPLWTHDLIYKISAYSGTRYAYAHMLTTKRIITVMNYIPGVK